MASFIDRAREKLTAWANNDEVELQSAEDQSEADKALVAFVENELNERRSTSARIALEGIALTNVAYLCGFDSVYFDGLSRQFKPIPAPSQLVAKHRVHVNRILPTVQNRLARLMKNEPRWEVRPNSGDEEAKDAARLAEQVILQLWEQTQINQKRAQLLMWCQQAGSAYLKICWDPTLGEARVLPVDEEQADGSVKRSYKRVTTGDIRVDICSFFEIFPDHLAKYWDECKSLVQAKIRPLSYFKEHYPERGGLVTQEDCWLNSLQYEARINALNTQTGASGMATNQLKNCAIERVYYEKPSEKHPLGRRVITANGVLLDDGVLPIDELPFVKFDDIIVGGKFNAEAIITHLRPLQDQINKGKAMRAAWLNRTLTGKYAAPRGANLARESMNDQSGEIVEYDAVPSAPNGGMPVALDPPSIPSYAYEEENTLKTDMDDTAGINEASRGQMPSAQIPAIGMQLLVEQDDTRIGVETEGHEHAYANLGRILLKFVDKYYTVPRLLKISGRSMEYTVREFVGDDIKEAFDVKVKRGSMAPGSKTLKRQEIINLHQGGYFGNPQDPLVLQNVLSMLEYGDEYQAWKRQSLVAHQIQRGIKMIEEQGQKPPVSEFDDHPQWIRELDNYRISDKFDLLDDEKKKIILECMNEHLNAETQRMNPDVDPDDDISLKTTNAAESAAQDPSQFMGGAEPQSAGGQLSEQIANGPNQAPTPSPEQGV